jgi:hypothetical protein
MHAGCFSQKNGPWKALGIPQPSSAFCRSFPATISDETLAAFTTTDSFEGDDPLKLWTLDISAGDARSDYEDTIFVECEGDGTPPYYNDGPDFGVPGAAADGECAARVEAGCDGRIVDNSGDYGPTSVAVPGTNTLSRAFYALNTGCAGGMKGYELSFALVWDNEEYCNDPYDYFDPATFPYNDVGKVTVEVSGAGEKIVKSYSSCLDVPSKAWKYFKVDVGKVPLGTLLSAKISVVSSNVGDCSSDSAVLIDDIKLLPKM